MTPKLKFEYSYIYQEAMGLPEGKEIDETFDPEVAEYLKDIKEEWENNGEEILKFMSELVGIEWNEPLIVCYVLRYFTGYPFSRPLTLSIEYYEGGQYYKARKVNFYDVLIHELIHNLFMNASEEKFNDYSKYLIKEKYKNESLNTAIHIPVHAIHRKIFEKFYNDGRLRGELDFTAKYPDYKRAWEIVLNEGADNIIAELKKMLS